MSEQGQEKERGEAPNHVGAGFDPSKYLRKMGTSDYLDVKWRLVWLRQRDPDAKIETTLVEHQGDAAVFKARVVMTTGAEASGWGSETMSDFRDYLEKAETKALGRALAALGFGTQFTPDYDLEQEPGLSGRERIADSPVEFASTRGRRMAGPEVYQQNAGATPTAQTVTSRQLKFIQAIAREAGLDEAAVRADVMESFGTTVEDLGRREASEYIERLQSLRNQQPISS